MANGLEPLPELVADAAVAGDGGFHFVVGNSHVRLGVRVRLGQPGLWVWQVAQGEWMTLSLLKSHALRSVLFEQTRQEVECFPGLLTGTGTSTDTLLAHGRWNLILDGRNHLHEEVLICGVEWRPAKQETVECHAEGPHVNGVGDGVSWAATGNGGSGDGA
jgi:hypothetical protein